MKKNNATKAIQEAKVDRGYISPRGQANIATLGKMLAEKETYVQELTNKAIRKMAKVMHRFDPNIPDMFRVDVLAETAGKAETFVPGEPVRISDLIGESHVNLENALKLSLGDYIKWDENIQRFVYQASGKYASQKFKFTLAPNDAISYDEFGFLMDPFLSSIISLSDVYGIRSGACFTTTIPCYATRDSNGTWLLRKGNPESSEDAIPAVYCRGYWGGSNSNTSGATCTDIYQLETEGRILDFERQASNGGKEGNDYYLLPRYTINEDGSKNTVDIEAHLHHIMAPMIETETAQRESFAIKIGLIRDARGMDKTAENAKQEADTELRELIRKCERAAVAKLSFVKAPKIKLRKEVSLAEKLNLRMTREELEKKVLSYGDRPSPMEYVRRKTQEVEAWLDFAPAYASLYSDVRRLNGQIKVKGKKTVITIPSARTLDGLDKIVGRYTESQFAMVRERLDDLLEMNSKNAINRIRRSSHEFDELMEQAKELHLMK